MKRTGIIGIVCILIIGGLVGLIVFDLENVQAGSGSILYVGGTGGGNYSSIQAAIDAANPGDTVFVYNGTYYENVIIKKTLSLIGENKNTTIINGNNNGYVISISANWVNITGLTITNSGDNWNDAGIELVGIQNCYIINNNISSNNGNGVWIRSSSYNNIISWNNVSNNFDGINLDSSTHTNNINNNNMLNNKDGVRLYSSSNNNISNNNISKNVWGIHLLSSSNNNMIIGNNIFNNYLDGVRLTQSSNKNNIRNNNISFNYQEGLTLNSVSENNIINNTIISNENGGLYLIESPNNYLKKNQFYNDGLFIRGFEFLDHISDGIFPDNLVNGKPLYYYKNSNGIKINGTPIGQLIIVNCTNIDISNLYINKTIFGIYILYSTNVYIRNNEFSSNINNGIHIASGLNITISNNNIYSNKYDGVFFGSSYKCNLMKNIIHSNGLNGVVIASSNDNLILKNHVYSNGQNGIYLGHNCDYNNFTGNHIYENNKNGISTYNAWNNEIVANNVTSNMGIGINLNSSWYNKIFNNNIYYHTNQAFNDDNGTNFWNNTYPTGGNYWSDYTGVDLKSGLNQSQSGSDDIGDTPYTNIDGGGGAQDHYPLMKPIEIERVEFSVPSFPKNLNVVAGNDYINLSWTLPESDGGFPITNYIIYKGTNSGDEIYHAKIGNQLFFNDTAVTNGITYYYQIRAVNAIGEGSLSNEVNATPFGSPDITPILIIDEPWIVKTTETYINETIILNNNLTIENTGSLTFKNVTLLMNCTNNGTYHIEVKDGGELFIFDFDNDPTSLFDASNITSYIPDGRHRYNFWVQKGAKFEMHNSILHECGWSSPWIFNDLNSGLFINTNNAIIENNLISDNHNGIILNYSDSNLISNNKFIDNVKAMHFQSSNNNSINDNNLSGNIGIKFITSNYNQFQNNSLFNTYLYFDSSNYNDINNNLFNGGNIRFFQSKNNNMINNLVSLENQYGICLEYSTNHELVNNKMIKSGIKIWGHLQEHWDSHIINNSNTVNGKPVIYWKDRKDEIVPQDSGQIILASCSNIYIEKFNINNVSCAVQFGFSNDIKIRGNNFSNNHDGIVFLDSTNNIIENNTLNSNRGSSIRFTESFKTTINNNTCNYNQHGISIAYSNNNIISNNICNDNNFIGIELFYSVENTVSKNYVAKNNRAGIQIQGYYSNVIKYNTVVYNNESGIAVIISDKCEIINNNVSFNNYYGIYNTGSNDNIISNNYALSNNKPGICVGESNYVNVSRNYIKDSDHGIFLGSSSWCTINNNIFINNGFGIEIYQSDSNTLFNNSLISNTQQAFDDSYNRWDNGMSAGNYWSDYNGTDANGDGIGDTPYIIDENSQDNYPLMEPKDIEIDNIENIEITLELNKTEFYLGENVTGSVHIQNNNQYKVYLNDQRLQSTGKIFPEDLYTYLYFHVDSLDTNAEFEGNYFYPSLIIVEAQSSLVIDFTLNQFTEVIDSSLVEYQTTLNPGDYSIYTYFCYGEFRFYDIINSNTVNFRIIDETSPPPGGNGGSGSGTDDLSTTIVFASVTGLVLLIIILTIFITATDLGKYKFASMFVAPLYARELRKRKRKDVFVRGKILGYVIGNPGDNYNTIKHKLKLTNGALAYHLQILERKHEIRPERDGVYKRFYPFESRITEEVFELSKLQKRIYNLIEERPGVTQTEISKELSESVQRINYHIQMMVDARIIKLVRKGKHTKCYILENIN